MNHIYQYKWKGNTRQLTNTEAFFFDMFDAVVDMYVEVKFIEATSDVIEINFSATPETIAICARDNYEVALFLDDCVTVFEQIKVYHHQFPLQPSYNSIDELKTEVRLFCSWVLEMLTDNKANQITKQNYLNLRSI